ncbi:GIY-YIG nuclease family protein [Mesorhizobium sp. M0968]|uniref:GIY-YIG nuclease family protein n=1 Tax=Mesorhizobium sp. M0968 TaxID=2957037 RepID=UPI00333C3F7E
MSRYTLNQIRTLDQALASSGDGVIYMVAWCDAGPVKIGKTMRLEQRLSGLQCGNPSLLFVYDTVFVSFGGIQVAESRIHSCLRERRLQGEWFDIAPGDAASECRALLARPPKPGPQPKTSHGALKARYLEVLSRSRGTSS